MPILDEEGFAVQDYKGKQVRSNFWNQINPRIIAELEQVDGFSTGMGEWYYYVKEIVKDEDHSYFVVFKNPNYKELLQPDSMQQEGEQDTVTRVGESEPKIRKTFERPHPTSQEWNGLPNDAIERKQIHIGKAELTEHPDIVHLKDCVTLPRSLLDKYVSIILIKKNVNIQIPEMYQLIKNLEDISVLGISRTKYNTVTVRDVFGTQ